MKTEEELKETLSEFEYPVVMKGLLEGNVHKTEMNLVIVDVMNEKDALKHYASLMESMDNRGTVLIQRQAKGAVELIAGFIRDPNLGPCVMCGLGGIFAEALADAAFAMAPLTMEEALDVIGRIKTKKLLDGFRGFPPLDKNAFARILTALGNLGCNWENIAEIDINPLIVENGAPVAVDASIILKR